MDTGNQIPPPSLCKREEFPSLAKRG